jgi:sugar lactone lactonase YvrE
MLLLGTVREFWVIGCHPVDQARYSAARSSRSLPIISNPVTARGSLNPHGDPMHLDDTAAILARLEGGLPVMIDASLVSFGRDNHLAWEIKGHEVVGAWNLGMPNELRISDRAGRRGQSHQTEDMTKIEQLTEPLAYHAEGPVWSDTWGGLRWVDMLAGDLLTLHADGNVERLHVGTVAAFVRPRIGGGYVVGVERGIALADAPDEAPEPLPELWSDTGIRMNEGGCDPAGNLYAGSMAYDRTAGAASLFRISPDGHVDMVLPQVTISNGIDFSPDGARAYYNDTRTGGTDVFDVVGGELTNRRALHRHENEHPDGLTVDSAGNIWTALNRHGKVRCYSPAGIILTEIDLPVRLVTACTLGGENGKDLFVTTSRENLEDPEPVAGAVFKVRVDVPGKPVLPYSG